jgi:radical SAM superfamily enzyme YgiQ (UPF0313 family)
MKFSFVNPGPNETLMEGEKTMTSASPPLGILYIASILKDEGIEVSVLDLAATGMSIKEAADWAIREDPDILGLSTLITSSLTAPKIAHEVKKKNPDVTIVFGNHHATFNAERILKKYPYVDMIVRGEGEQTCLELVNCLKEKRLPKEVLGVTFRHKGHVVSNLDRPLLKNVDLLPFPDRDLIDVDYHNTTVGINVAPKKFASFLSSRGCVFKCRFCSCARIAHNFWRPRSTENVLEELHLLASEGYEQIMFVDDNFTLNRKRVINLCRRMRKEKIRVEWISEGRVDQCSSSMLQEMVKAGCRMMYFGIESGTQKVLNYYDKRTTPEQSKTAVEKARKAGVDIIVGSFVIGAPHETRKDIQKTLNFVRKLDLDIPQINILGAFPGNSIWEEFKDKELLDEDESWETGVCISDIYPHAVPLDEMRKMVREFYRNYLRSPRYMMKEILLTLKSPYRMNVVFHSLSRFSTVMDGITSFTSR